MIEAFLVSFAVSVVTIPFVLFISKKFNFYDRIDERKIHNGNISRLGGAAIFLGFVIPFWFIAYPIRARYKLLSQIAIGVLVALSGLTVDSFDFFGLFKYEFGVLSGFLTVIWVILFMNAINLLDGMDGLASGIVFIANIFVFFIALLLGKDLVMSLTLMMAGAILGFYLFNFPPAKIFMGDGGAYFLGFMYATLPLMGIKKTSVATLFLFPLILLLLPN